MIPYNIRHIAAAAIVTAMAALSGCVSEEVMPCEPENRSTVRLNLTIDTGTAPAGRADLGDHDKYEDPSGDFEKIHQLRIIIARLADKEEGKWVIEANRLVATSDEGYPIGDNLEFEVVANEDKRIYLIANERFLTPPVGMTGTATSFLNSFAVVDGDEDDEVDFTPFTNWTVSLPNLTDATTTVTTGIFSPNVATNRLPLTEVFDFYVDSNKAVDDICYAHFFLTRAAAKARFYINATDNFTGTEVANVSIQAIRLSGIGTTEYVFPNNAVYSTPKELLTAPGNVIETYITSFATPAANRPVTYEITGLNVEIEKPADGKPSLIQGVNGASTIYFPESILAARQHYMVSVQLNDAKGTWLTAPLETNILSIEDDNGEKRDAIARDTALPIIITFNGATDIRAEVLPWNREDYYVDYAANVGFAGNEKFLEILGTPGQTGDYLSLNKDNAQLVLNYGKTARGTFEIASPIGAQWDAYMITTGGRQDAIQFQIPDPADDTKTITTTHISGKIDGTPANFGIVATVAPGATQNSAQLMVIVTLVDGTPVVADAIKNWNAKDGNGKKIDRLTIIENPI